MRRFSRVLPPNLSSALARPHQNARPPLRANYATIDCKDSGVAPTNDQTGILYKESAFDPSPIMKTPVDLFRRGYELLVSGANLLKSTFLLLLSISFFCQIFQPGQDKYNTIH